MTTRIIIATLLFALIGCKSGTGFLPPSLAFDQSETKWREGVSTLTAKNVLTPKAFIGDTSYLYQWEFDDALYPVEIKFNDDVIHGGPLRMVTY